MINILERGIPWQIDREGGRVDYSLTRNSIVHDVSSRRMVPSSFDNLIPIRQDFCRDTRSLFEPFTSWKKIPKIPI